MDIDGPVFSLLGFVFIIAALYVGSRVWRFDWHVFGGKQRMDRRGQLDIAQNAELAKCPVESAGNARGTEETAEQRAGEHPAVVLQAIKHSPAQLDDLVDTHVDWPENQSFVIPGASTSRELHDYEQNARTLVDLVRGIAGNANFSRAHHGDRSH